MVTLLLDSTRLEVVLSAGERLMAFRRRDIAIERSHIVTVQLTDDAWTWLRGVPDPGVYVPSVVAAGTWKSASGRDFVVIHRRRPSVVVDLAGHDEFQRIILTTRHGVELTRALRLDAGDELADVAEIVAGTPPARPSRSGTPRPATA